MVNIFDYLKSILFTKKDLNIRSSEEENFDLFMVNRWCSMVDKDSARIINETTNKFGFHLDTKEKQLKFLQTVLPRYKFHKINYIKRKSVE
jgi:hypothetical protein